MRRIGAGVATIPAAVLKRLDVAEALAGDAMTTAGGAAQQAAAADAVGRNARGMVISDRQTYASKFTSLEQVAAKFDTEIAKADGIHTAETEARIAGDKTLQDQLDAVKARTLTARAAQYRTTLAVAVNGNLTGSVTFATPFPDTTWVPLLVTSVPVTGEVTWSAKTAASIAFSVKYAGTFALTVGSVVTVEGFRLG